MASDEVLCPFRLDIEPIARFLNCELGDHPVYDGLELQAFDDDVHGTGMLAFLSRRADRRVDFYVQPGLSLDRARFSIGAGIGHWVEADFDSARLEIGADGVDAEVRFHDLDGRPVEVRIDDRDGRTRRRATLLAPFGAGIERPSSLLLVVMHGFDLVRDHGGPAGVAIDGEQVSTGQLPAAWLHRRRLVKYAGPLVVTSLTSPDGDLPRVRSGSGAEVTDRGLTALTAGTGAHGARVAFDPAFPDLRAVGDGEQVVGRWTVAVDATVVTGGAFSVQRRGDEVSLGLDVERRWRPRRLPLLMRVVTTVVPTFRAWPTTYRWRGVARLDGIPTLTGGWERLGDDGGDAYRRATGTAAR